MYHPHYLVPHLHLKHNPQFNTRACAGGGCSCSGWRHCRFDDGTGRWLHWSAAALYPPAIASPKGGAADRWQGGAVWSAEATQDRPERCWSV